MRFLNSCDCPECGPYVPKRRSRSRWLQFVAMLMMSRCYRCGNCGIRFFVARRSMLRRLITAPVRALSLLSLLLFALPASGAIINGSFENGFDNWTATGDPYIVTDTGSGRTRSEYQTYFGWEGADVWFSSLPDDGSRYAVFGSQGNESTGSLTSDLWTAEFQFLNFSHAGNNTSGLPVAQRSYAAILDPLGNELTRTTATSFNDSVWRHFSIDLAAAGLNFGDQYRVFYEDGASWSVIDDFSESGPALAAASVPEPSAFALLGCGLMGFAVERFRRKVTLRNAAMTTALLMITVMSQTSADAAIIHQWSFEDNLLDTSGSGNHGVVSGGDGTADYINGQFGRAININSAEGIVDLAASNLPLGGTDAWTMNAWFNFASAPANLTYLAGFGIQSADDAGKARAFLNANSGFFFWGSSADVNSGTAYVADGTWQMHTIVKDGGNIHMYTNGAHVLTGANTLQNSPYNRVQVGNPSIWSNQARLGIDEFTIWDEALSDTEVATLFGNTASVPEPSSVVLLGCGLLSFGTRILRRHSRTRKDS